MDLIMMERPEPGYLYLPRQIPFLWGLYRESEPAVACREFVLEKLRAVQRTDPPIFFKS